MKALSHSRNRNTNTLTCLAPPMILSSFVVGLLSDGSLVNLYALWLNDHCMFFGCATGGILAWELLRWWLRFMSWTMRTAKI